jgi:hypothetical protein
MSPNLRESKIVLHFKTQWPKAHAAKAKAKEKDSEPTPTHSAVAHAMGKFFSVLMLHVLILQLLGALFCAGHGCGDIHRRLHGLHCAPTRAALYHQPDVCPAPSDSQ